MRVCLLRCLDEPESSTLKSALLKVLRLSRLMHHLYVIVIVLLLFKGILIVISWGSSFGSEDGAG